VIRFPFSGFIVVTILPLAVGPASGALLNWPATSDDWNPLTAGGAYYTDPKKDYNPDRIDIVGTSTVTAGGWYFDDYGPSSPDTQLMFRMRLSQGNPLGNYVWQILIDTDGVTSGNTAIDYSLQVNNSGASQVELLAAVDLGTGQQRGGPNYNDVEFNTTALWSGALADYSRIVDPVDDGQHIGDGTADAWIDWGIPWSEFAAVTGVAYGSTIQVQLSTSASHSVINKDHPHDLGPKSPVSGGFSDVILVPEPASLTLLCIAGVCLLGFYLYRRRNCKAA